MTQMADESAEGLTEDQFRLLAAVVTLEDHGMGTTWSNVSLRAAGVPKTEVSAGLRELQTRGLLKTTYFIFASTDEGRDLLSRVRGERMRHIVDEMSDA